VRGLWPLYPLCTHEIERGRIAADQPGRAPWANASAGPGWTARTRLRIRRSAAPLLALLLAPTTSTRADTPSHTFRPLVRTGACPSGAIPPAPGQAGTSGTLPGPRSRRRAAPRRRVRRGNTYRTGPARWHSDLRACSSAWV